MYLVTFRLDPGEYDAEFHELNDAIQTAAEETEGYLGKRTWQSPESEEVLVVYYWKSSDALEIFGADADHKRAKQRWTEWYDAYEVTVTEVVEAYGSGFGDDTDPPALVSSAYSSSEVRRWSDIYGPYLRHPIFNNKFNYYMCYNYRRKPNSS